MIAQLAENSGTIEVTLQLDVMKESLDFLQQGLTDDVQSKLQVLQE